MNREEKKLALSRAEGIVPQLRFPEFKEKWETNILGNKKISFFPNDKTPINKLEIETYVSTENLLPDYGGVKQSNKLPDSGSFTSYQKGDILVANIRPYLKKVWFADRSGAASNDVIVFRNGSSLSEDYLQHILKNDLFINYVMKGAKGVKMPRGDKSLMKTYPVSFPSNPKEQQKIAACLFSLDDIITAETEKLILLQDHKKGLLQQLFPADGETVPKFRFPEFKDDGDWTEKEIGETIELLADYTANGSFASLKENVTYYSEDNYAVLVRTTDLEKKNFEPQRFTDERGYKFLKKTSLFGGEIILANVGSIGNVYRVPTFTKPMTLAPNTYLLKFKKSIIEDFIYQLMLRTEFKNKLLSMVGSSTLKAINKSNLRSIKIFIPKPKEQQKIAQCLSATDELIEAQAQKIEALQEHKKGLLQQLFPNLNELAV